MNSFGPEVFLVCNLLLCSDKTKDKVWVGLLISSFSTVVEKQIYFLSSSIEQTLGPCHNGCKFGRHFGKGSRGSFPFWGCIHKASFRFSPGRLGEYLDCFGVSKVVITFAVELLQKEVLFFVLKLVYQKFINTSRQTSFLALVKTLIKQRSLNFFLLPDFEK